MYLDWPIIVPLTNQPYYNRHYVFPFSPLSRFHLDQSCALYHISPVIRPNHLKKGLVPLIFQSGRTKLCALTYSDWKHTSTQIYLRRRETAWKLELAYFPDRYG